VILHPTALDGAFTIELEKRGDHRGFFARLFCADEFAAAGLETSFIQINNSLTQSRGTLRGMHYQLPPDAEVKLVRCVRGSLYDVILDLRPDSATFGRHFGCELNAENTEAVYLVSNRYVPEQERGLRWDDPVFSIELPIPVHEMSEKDRSWPAFDKVYHAVDWFRTVP
jgi:dTDP-4-dehydrorhamnose 3,5-epimerase